MHNSVKQLLGLIILGLVFFFGEIRALGDGYGPSLIARADSSSAGGSEGSWTRVIISINEQIW